MSDSASTAILHGKIAQAVIHGGAAGPAALAAAQQVLAGAVQGGELRAAPKSSLYGLLLAFLEHGRTFKPALEAALTRLRRELLADAVAGRQLPPGLSTALALHCFNNEYVFAESPKETAQLAALRDRLGVRPAPDAAAVYAAYRPLANESWIAVLRQSSDPGLHRLVAVHVDEPARERALLREIPSITPIEDPVSREVQEQYEQNPYPRWQRLDIDPSQVLQAGAGQRVLVAGCGTGKQPLRMALASPGDRFWALDLSRVSLAYAMRKAEEHGLANISFLHGDILELPKAGMTFDTIVSSGVLHHLDSPASGLRALGACLAPGGVVKIELYTPSAAVEAGIALRRARDLPPTAEGIRRFRALVHALPADHPAAGLYRFEDFHAVSECRDLVFHVKEHRLSLAGLADMIAAAGFSVSKIYPSAEGQTLFARAFPAMDAFRDIAAWVALERGAPADFGARCFGPMFRLTLTKE